MALISVDFYGSLNEDPDFWQEFLGYVVEEGHKVSVITGPWPKDVTEKLEFGGYKLGKHYHNVHSVLWFLSEMGLDIWYDEDHDSWYSAEFPWWRAKAKICKDNGISLHLDSDERFADAFKTVPTRFVDISKDPGKDLLRKWYNSLKQANTYEDWEDEYMYMFGGIVPM